MVDEKKFLDELTDLMDTEEALSLDTILAEVEEWDSLSHVSFMSYVVRYANNTKITPMDIRNAKTVRDLYNFVCG